MSPDEFEQIRARHAANEYAPGVEPPDVMAHDRGVLLAAVFAARGYIDDEACMSECPHGCKSIREAVGLPVGDDAA